MSKNMFKPAVGLVETFFILKITVMLFYIQACLDFSSDIIADSSR